MIMSYSLSHSASITNIYSHQFFTCTQIFTPFDVSTTQAIIFSHTQIVTDLQPPLASHEVSCTHTKSPSLIPLHTQAPIYYIRSLNIYSKEFHMHTQSRSISHTVLGHLVSHFFSSSFQHTSPWFTAVIKVSGRVLHIPIQSVSQTLSQSPI